MPDTNPPTQPFPEEPAVDELAGAGPDEPWSITVEPAEPADSPAPAEQAGPGYVVTRSWGDMVRPAAVESAAQPEPAAAPAPRRSGFWRTAGIAAVAALVGAASAFGVFSLLDEDQASPPVTIVERVATEIVTADGGGSTAAAVARAVLPSIVTVQVSSSDVGTFVPDGSGSGVVLSADEGLLITNDHVVEDAQQVKVVFADGRAYDAEIVGTDPLTDLAVLRIAAAGLTAVEIGASETMAIGDTAIAIGSPLGLEGGPSVTVGVISAFERRVQTSIDSELFGMLQTDAPITRGSSGGALVDAQGRLIGITTAIGISDVGAEGLGFAIPIELVLRITDDLIEFGQARHAFLGVTGSTYFTEAADGATIPAGVEVASVFDDTAAALAGIEAGDILISVNGDDVTTMEQLVTAIRLFPVDEPIDIVVERAGETLTIPVVLLERPEDV